jgi:transcription elongation factor Elf1
MGSETVGDWPGAKNVERCPHCNNYLYSGTLKNLELKIVKCSVCDQNYLVSGSEKSGTNILRL